MKVYLCERKENFPNLFFLSSSVRVGGMGGKVLHSFATKGEPE